MLQAGLQADSENVTHRDGIGDRRLQRSADGDRETLLIRGELSAVPTFEPALRERVSRLASFRHSYYVPAHTVVRTGDADAPLALVSDHVTGGRLSALFSSAAARGLNLDINAGLCLIRQLVPAVAKLHESAPDLAHGVLGPERIVVTPHARLAITESALGPAVEQLRYSQERYWKDLRVALPRSAGLPRFDQRADVVQIGVIALSLVLGRLLRDDEYPSKIGDVVASAWVVSPRGGFEPMPPGLRGWLARALQIDVRNSFATALEAREGLEQMLGESEYLGSPGSLEAFLAKYAAAEALEQFAIEARPAGEPEESTTLSEEEAAESAPGARLLEFDAETPAASANPDLPPRVEDVPSALAAYDSPPAEPLSVRQSPTPLPGPPVAPDADPFPDMFGQADPPSRGWLKWLIAGCSAAAVLVAVGLPFARLDPPVSPVPAPTGTLTVSTNPPGAMALIDGQPSGTTPLTTTVAAGSHVVELRGSGAPRTLSVVVAAGAESAHYVELPQPGSPVVTVDGGPQPPRSTDPSVSPAAATPTARAGWLLITAPFELQVREGERFIGSSASGRVTLTPGRHDLELVSDILGYRTVRTVEVTPGTTSPIKIDVPNGTLAVNALPWADVWLDGARIGETPIGNLQVPIGAHEVVLKHPDFGEQRHRVVVTATSVSRLSADLTSAR